MKLLAWFGLTAPVIRLSLILVIGFLQPGYSQTRDYISELGALDAPYAWLMNSLGTIFVGFLLVGFSVALWKTFRPGFLILIGSMMLGIAGVAFLGVGVFPCDAGCVLDDPSTTMQRHLQAGTIAMFAQTLAPVTIGVALLVAGRHSTLGWTSVTLGGAAILSLFVLFSRDASFPYPGALQKMFQVATDIWVFVSAMVVLKLQNAR